MNAAGLSVLMLAAIGIGWLILSLAAKERARARARGQFAAQRGWTYLRGGKPGRLYLIEGSEGGSPWTLEAFQGGKRKATLTVWKCSDPPMTEGVVFIGSKGMAAMLKNPLGHKIIKWGLQFAGGDDDVSRTLTRLMDGYQEVETGDPEFAAVYAVLATDPGQAAKLLNGETRRAMLEWDLAHKIGRASQGPLGATWSDAGLSLTWGAGAIESPEDVSAFLALAQRLRSATKSAW